jgi:hypothetical protein
MQDPVSFLAIIVSVVGLVVAFLSYRISSDIRVESSQLRLVDKIASCSFLIKKSRFLIENIKDGISILNESILVVEGKRISGSEFVLKDLKNQLLDMTKKIERLEEKTSNLDERNDSISIDLSDLGLSKSKSANKTFYKLYVDVSNIKNSLDIIYVELERSFNETNSHIKLLKNIENT